MFKQLWVKKATKKAVKSIEACMKVEIMRKYVCKATKCSYCGFFNQLTICACSKCLNPNILCECPTACGMFELRMKRGDLFDDYDEDTLYPVDPLTTLGSQGYLEKWLNENRIQITKHWRQFGLCSDAVLTDIVGGIEPYPPQFCAGCLTVASAIDQQFPNRISDVASRLYSTI